MSKLLIVLTASAALSFGQGKSRPGPPRSMELPMYGFAVEPPVGWLAGMDKATMLPVFVNTALSTMEDLRRLPVGGAIINVLVSDDQPRRRGDKSLSDWARFDAVNAAPGTVTTGTLDMPASTGVSDAILVSFDEATYGPDDQAQREVSVYWTFRGKKFAAHLFYVVGDPKGVEHEGALKEIIRSIRPL